MAEAPVARRARAKVNLDLLVTARRPDGYHELDSLVVFAGACDLVTASAAPSLQLDIDGPFAEALPRDETNLVMAAARELAWAAGTRRGAAMRLTKALPVAAGLGGGSADAAATLYALNQLWRAGLPPERLRDIGLTIGADVPVCLHGGPVRVRGVGERLDPVRGLPDLPLLLVNPGVPLSTAAVFKALRLPDEPERAPFPPTPSIHQLAAWLGEGRNDLEPAAIGLEPAIGETLGMLRHLPDCLVARMSGSGATCWALFADAADLAAADAALAAARPAWWRWAGVVHNPA